MAAQWSAVIPSPCGALTSTACFNNARTPAASLRIAASATRASPARAVTPADVAASALTIAKSPTSCFVRAMVGSLDRFRDVPRAREVERRRAVAKAADIVHTERVQHAQHGVGHRRAVAGLHVQTAGQAPVRAAREEERAAFVIVEIR